MYICSGISLIKPDINLYFWAFNQAVIILLENIHIGFNALDKLADLLKSRAFDKVVVLTDTNTQIHCYPVLKPYLPDHQVIEVKSGEVHKSLETCSYIWQQMTKMNLNRWSLLINLGGGVIGDMGGFCAGVFKRGIYFVQVPTTLLSQVDASVGGKTGIDFMGYKNHIGVFQDPLAVFIYPDFLKTLSPREIKSGYAEIIKHWFIAKKASFEEQKHIGLMTEDWSTIIQESVAIKAEVVQSDPLEHGYRKVLNFGHTIGHAIETYFLEKPGQSLLHGEAIAVGMICETYISRKKGLLTEQEQTDIEVFITSVYEKVVINAAEIAQIAPLALQDKKNTGSVIKCTLLDGIGKAIYDQPITIQEIQEAIHYYCHL